MRKRKSIKFEYDRESDAAYLRIQRGKVIDSEEVEPGLILDLNEHDQVIDIEILRFARRFARRTKKLAS
jgi:uncharacterized protein YuzE